MGMKIAKIKVKNKCKNENIEWVTIHTSISHIYTTPSNPYNSVALDMFQS